MPPRAGAPCGQPEDGSRGIGKEGIKCRNGDADDDEERHSPFCMPRIVHEHYMAITTIYFRQRYRLPSPHEIRHFIQLTKALPVFASMTTTSIINTIDTHTYNAKLKRRSPSRNTLVSSCTSNSCTYIARREYSQNHVTSSDNDKTSTRRLPPFAVTRLSLCKTNFSMNRSPAATIFAKAIGQSKSNESLLVRACQPLPKARL